MASASAANAQQATIVRSTAVRPNTRHLQLAAGDVWEATARALCDARHLYNRARWLTAHDASEPLAVEHFLVPSVSQPESTMHLVTFDAAAHAFHCDCLASLHERPCCHVGAVAYAVDQLAYAHQVAHDPTLGLGEEYYRLP